MRKSLLDQLLLVPAPIDHSHAKELAAMSALLDRLPEAVELVHRDLLWRKDKQVDRTKGRKGLSAEQVLRILVVKQMNGYSYEELAFHLADSNSYRSFCRFGIGDSTPKKSTLQKNVKRVKAETWEAVNRMLVQKADELGVESGRKVRSDCTVVESHIHHPTDSTLLWDGVRVLVRLMTDAKEEFGIAFSNHSRRAKRRAMGILNAKSFRKRVPLYRDLLKVATKIVMQAEQVAEQLDKVRVSSIAQVAKVGALASELRRYVALTNQVVSQTERRVLRGESVPASEKIVSIFEPHADIIRKDHRDTYYGHKICLTSGASGLVTDVVVHDGNPSDSTLAVAMVERQSELYGRVPRQVSFDGGFASKDNLAAIKKLGVEDVAFAKRCGLAISDMVKSSWVYRKLRNFRAGIEGTISFLKRVFGLDRCHWRGLASFNAYVQAAVFAGNLLTLARHVLAN